MGLKYSCVNCAEVVFICLVLGNKTNGSSTIVWKLISINLLWIWNPFLFLLSTFVISAADVSHVLSHFIFWNSLSFLLLSERPSVFLSAVKLLVYGDFHQLWEEVCDAISGQDLTSQLSPAFTFYLTADAPAWILVPKCSVKYFSFVGRAQLGSRRHIMGM